jgi:4-amino-4-deoxy-L-arabinose transferase-like glycosyltransferase
MPRRQVRRTARPKPVPVEAPPELLARLEAHARHPLIRASALVLLLGFFAVHGIIAARTETPTPDEFIYVPAGYYHLRTGDLGFETTNPPLLKFAMALPLLAMDLQLDLDPRWRDNRTGWGAWIFGTRFMELNRARYLDAFFAARLMVVALGVLLGALVFHRASALLSPLGALATLLLYATMPPLIAHSAVGTLDVGVTVFVFAMFVAAERFAATKALPWAALSGVLFGLAFTAKGVAALFLPLVPVLVVLDPRARGLGGIRRLVEGAALMTAGAWFAVLAAYGFSEFPLPTPLLEGISFQLAASSAGEYPAFLNGRWSPTGWWYYYLVALVLKTPLPSLVLLGAGAVAVARRRLRDADLWIVLPPLFLLYVLSFHYGKNYGIRYLLPAFPFFLLLAGRGVDAVLRADRHGLAVVAALLAWQLAACTLVAPHHLAYFNELAGGPDRARYLLLDSNLDWGQDLGRLKPYLDARGTKHVCLGYFGHVDPHLYGIDFSLPAPTPTPGLCAVSANFLAGYPYAITYAGERILGVRAEAWSWFDRLRPVARIGQSIYVFDVTPDDVRRLSASGRARAQ